jgi:hypothetical protein
VAQRVDDLRFGIAGAEVRVLHREVTRRTRAARLAIDPQRGAERGSRVAGRRLHPDVVEHAGFAQEPVHHAVERDAAGHRETPKAGAPTQPTRHVQHRFLEHALCRVRDVGVHRQKRVAGAARRAEARERRRIDDVAAVALPANALAHLRDEARRSVRRERHHLVFVRRVQEAQVTRDVLVEQAERMRQRHFVEPLVAAVAIHPVLGRRVLAAAVESQHGAFVEGRREERARLMREVMRHEVPSPRRLCARRAQTTLQVMRDAAFELARRIDDVRQEERIPGFMTRDANRRGLERQRDLARHPAAIDEQVGRERIRYVVDRVDVDAGLAQAIVDRVERQLPRRERDGPLAVLDLREALLFGRRDDLAVDDEARGRIVERRVDAERPHGASLASTKLPGRRR